MKRFLLAFLLLALALAMISCAASPSAANYSTAKLQSSAAPAAAPPAPALPPTAAGAGPAVTTDSTGAQALPNVATADRMIVYTVKLRIEVQDPDRAANDIAAIAAQYKGYVSASDMNRDSQNLMRGTITLRIPAESLDAAQKQIEAAGRQVLSRTKNSNDVTDQYSDLNARLTNLQATRDDLRKMLDSVTAKSSRAEDILAVYNQLSAIQGQIEQVKGQMNVLEKTTALATLVIELVPQQDVQIVEPESWLPNQTAAQALRALVQALQGIINLAIWFILFLLPILILLLLPFVLVAWILRYLVQRRARKKLAEST